MMHRNPEPCTKALSRGATVAEQVFLEVKESHPDLQLITSSSLGPLYMEALQAGDLDQALDICKLWALGMPEDVGPLFSLGRVHRARGENAEAIRAYQRILEIAPGHPAAERARAAIRELEGEADSGPVSHPPPV